MAIIYAYRYIVKTNKIVRRYSNNTTPSNCQLIIRGYRPLARMGGSASLMIRVHFNLDDSQLIESKLDPEYHNKLRASMVKEIQKKNILRKEDYSLSYDSHIYSCNSQWDLPLYIMSIV